MSESSWVAVTHYISSSTGVSSMKVSGAPNEALAYDFWTLHVRVVKIDTLFETRDVCEYNAPFLGNICEEKKQRRQISAIFFMSKAHYSVKNCSIVHKIKHDLNIIKINMYTKFNFNVWNLCKENERRLQIIGNFLRSRIITPSKLAQSYQKLNLT